MREKPLGRRDALWLLFSGLLGASPLPAWGAEPAAPLDDHAKAINRAAATPEGGQRVVEHLSKELNVPAASLRAQREQSKLGWGELSIANRLSQKTGVPVDQLIAEHKSGKGWGVIAKERNVKLGPMVSELKKSDQALEAKAKKADKGDKGDKGNKAAKADKADKGFSMERGAGSAGRGGGHGGGKGK